MDQLLSTLVLLQTETPEDLPVDMETLMLISMVATLVFLVIGLVAGYWVYKDASKRENSELLWAIGVGVSFLLFPIGIVVPIAYLVLRGDEVRTESENTTAAGDW